MNQMLDLSVSVVQLVFRYRRYIQSSATGTHAVRARTKALMMQKIVEVKERFRIARNCPTAERLRISIWSTMCASNQSHPAGPIFQEGLRHGPSIWGHGCAAESCAVWWIAGAELSVRLCETCCTIPSCGCISSLLVRLTPWQRC